MRRANQLPGHQPRLAQQVEKALKTRLIFRGRGRPLPKRLPDASHFSPALHRAAI